MLRLPDGVPESAVATAAATMGVRVNGLGRYRLQTTDGTVDPLPPALVLGFGNVTESRIRRGIGVIADAVRQVDTERPPVEVDG